MEGRNFLTNLNCTRVELSQIVRVEKTEARTIDDFIDKVSDLTWQLVAISVTSYQYALTGLELRIVIMNFKHEICCSSVFLTQWIPSISRKHVS